MDLIDARDLLLGLWDKEEDEEEDEEEEDEEDEEEKGQVLEQVKESEQEQRKQEHNEEDEQVETKQGLVMNVRRKRAPLAPEQRKRLLTPHSLWTKQQKGNAWMKSSKSLWKEFKEKHPEEVAALEVACQQENAKIREARIKLKEKIASIASSASSSSTQTTLTHAQQEESFQALIQDRIKVMNTRMIADLKATVPSAQKIEALALAVVKMSDGKLRIVSDASRGLASLSVNPDFKTMLMSHLKGKAPKSSGNSELLTISQAQIDNFVDERKPVTRMDYVKAFKELFGFKLKPLLNKPGLTQIPFKRLIDSGFEVKNWIGPWRYLSQQSLEVLQANWKIAKTLEVRAVPSNAVSTSSSPSTVASKEIKQEIKSLSSSFPSAPALRVDNNVVEEMEPKKKKRKVAKTPVPLSADLLLSHSALSPGVNTGSSLLPSSSLSLLSVAVNEPTQEKTKVGKKHGGKKKIEKEQKEREEKERDQKERERQQQEHRQRQEREKAEKEQKEREEKEITEKKRAQKERERQQQEHRRRHEREKAEKEQKERQQEQSKKEEKERAQKERQRQEQAEQTAGRKRKQKAELERPKENDLAQQEKRRKNPKRKGTSENHAESETTQSTHKKSKAQITSDNVGLRSSERAKRPTARYED